MTTMLVGSLALHKAHQTEALARAYVGLPGGSTTHGAIPEKGVGSEVAK